MNAIKQNLITLSLVVMCFVAGNLFSNISTLARHDSTSYLLAKVFRVSFLIKTKLLSDISDEKLFDAAIQGLLEQTQDPYTRYLKPQKFKLFNEQQQGFFNGLGIIVGLSNQKLVITKVVEQSPADKSGLKLFDQIVKIESIPTEGISFETAQKLLLGDGKAGSSINLSILRAGSQQEQSITVRREALKSQVVFSKVLAKQIGYIHLESFLPSQAYVEVKKALERLKTQKIAGLIVDLRNNPGGDLNNVVNIVNYFMSSGAIVRVIDRNKREEIYEATSEVLLDESIPIVVLVNGGSASASETLAGALKDNKRAILMGTRTFGKGLVQSVFPLNNGGGLILTTNKYLTANGSDIDQKGIEPHIEVPFSNELAHKMPVERDVQIQAAIKHLNNEIFKKNQ